MKHLLVWSLLVAASTALAHEGKQHPPGAAHAEPPAPPPAVHGHAQGDHAHASPHGGIVATIDRETHVEVVFSDKALLVFFFDADMRPIPLPVDAKATVVIGKEVKKLELPVAKKPDGTPDDHLVAQLGVAVDQKAAVVIQGTVLGKARSARVEKPATPPPAAAPAAAPADAVHQGAP